MIEGLDKLLEGQGQPGLAELSELLEGLEIGDRRGWRLLSQEPLQSPGRRVFRLQLACDGQTRSFVAKRLAPAMARRSELIARRWLPALGLKGACPALLGSAVVRDNSCAWQLYEDLGPWDLAQPDRQQLSAAVNLIAQIHTGFADHPLLGEIRLHGTDYGIHFFQTNVHDALCALQAVNPPPDQCDLCTRLLDRLRHLSDQLPVRTRALTEFGGPETLLHGDLWTINVFVQRNNAGLEARLLDWDRAGVGPASYDLSTFLLRFPEPDRAWILNLYRKAVASRGWHLPGERELNQLFETAELARYANRVIWPAIALVQDGADWAFAELAEIEHWFENLEPVLPTTNQAQLRDLAVPVV